MIKVVDVYKSYYLTKDKYCKALNGISFTIDDGEIVAITGKSGSGKSTIMHIIGCIDDYDNGEVIIDGKSITKMKDKEKAAFRNSVVGIVLQDFALIPEYTVYENVAIPLIFKKNGMHNKKHIENALTEVGMIEYKNQKANQLSGGQKQRVAIARAIINNPKYILADEPTGALDSETTKQIMDIFLELNSKGRTVVIITHEQEIAAMCSRIINLKDGKTD